MISGNMGKNPTVKNWARFDRQIRNSDAKLLAELPRFPDAILVAGCQRSGTTAVTRILQEAIGMTCPKFTRDDELDAALILYGAIQFDPETRCCFQTTYVNGHLNEYFEHDNYRLVWILRNPEAVVTSMLLNWRRGALNRLFRACGRHALNEQGMQRFRVFGTAAFRRIDMACLSYNVKTAQVHQLAAHLGRDRILVIDYDELIDRRETVLPEMFAFACVSYNERYLASLRPRSAMKKPQLGESMRSKIHDLCDNEYHKAISLAATLRGGAEVI